ncbi:unnamed protein product [Ambrosiozyma monospora]|uniref:Unnamed protein product n=1 Tax=Ambrosiozyma monospora TaxID=43982 RepID=A0ACB5UDL6_AMBMO|nr:unnamed protein product [Ambrosiozyma monospora]
MIFSNQDTFHQEDRIEDLIDQEEAVAVTINTDTNHSEKTTQDTMDMNKNTANMTIHMLMITAESMMKVNMAPMKMWQ